MALRIGEYVIYGKLYNQKNYSTHGIIVLRGPAPGEETVLHLELTGNCERDLRGKAFRFTPDGSIDYLPVFPIDEHPRLQTRQIGPTGHMTAQGWVKAFSCSVEEYVQRASLGEPPPTEWKRHLYLEWYGQNGRVLVEMAGARVEECVRHGSGEDDEGDWVELPNLAVMPEAVTGRAQTGLGITIVRTGEDDVPHIEQWTADPAPEHDDNIPPDLQRALDHDAHEIDRALGGQCEEDADMRDTLCVNIAETVPCRKLV